MATCKIDEEIIKISKNPVRAKALRDMAKERLEDIREDDKPYRKLEEYY